MAEDRSALWVTGILSYIRPETRENPDSPRVSVPHGSDAQQAKMMPIPAPKIAFQRLNLR